MKPRNISASSSLHTHLLLLCVSHNRMSSMFATSQIIRQISLCLLICAFTLFCKSQKPPQINRKTFCKSSAPPDFHHPFLIQNSKMHIKTCRWRPSHRHKHSRTDSEVQKWAQFGSEKSMFATLKPETVGTTLREKKWSGTWNSKTEISFTDQKRRETRHKREKKMSPSPPDIGNEEGTLHHSKWTFDCHCKGMRSPAWCGLTPSPVLFAWSAFLCSQRCRLPWWAVIRGVKLAVNMPEQKYGSFLYSGTQYCLSSAAAERILTMASHICAKI